MEENVSIADRKFRYGQTIALIALTIGNFHYSFIKKSFSVSVPTLKRELGLSNLGIGAITSKFSIAYGFSKFLGGILCDWYPADNLFNIGLLLGSLVNCVIACCGEKVDIGFIWLTNGVAQGVGGPALSKIVVDLFPPERVGSVWSMLNFASNIGFLVSPFILLPALNNWGWKGPFWLAGTVGVMFFVIVIFMMRKNENFVDNNTSAKIDNKTKQIKDLDKSKNIVSFWKFFECGCLLIANILTYFTMKGMADWMGLYLVEHIHYSTTAAMELMVWNELGGITGSFCVGFISDFWFKNRKALTSLLFCLPCYLALYALNEPFLTPLVPGHSNNQPQCQWDQNINNESFSHSTLTSHCIWVNGTDRNNFNNISMNATKLNMDEMVFNSFNNVALENTSTENTFHTDGAFSFYVFSVLTLSQEIVKIVLKPLISIFELILKYLNISWSDVSIRVLVFIAGFGINGPKSLLAMALSEGLSKKYVGSVSGAVGLLAQLGASFSGAGLGMRLEEQGWSSYLPSLMFSTIVLSLFLIPPAIRRW